MTIFLDVLRACHGRLNVPRHRARAFREGAETFDLSFGSPPAWQSALREYQERKPRRPPSKAIAINESTDGPAILRRVFSEPIEPDENDRGPDLTVSPPR